MSNRDASGEPFAIAGWCVDPSSLRISNEEKTIKLEPIAMAVLNYLARSPGTVVTRRELQDSVWTGTVVGYDALSNAIIKLRKVLGDKARDLHIIETIAKSGYRLITEVTEVAANTKPPATVLVSTREGRPPRASPARPSIAVLPFDKRCSHRSSMWCPGRCEIRCSPCSGIGVHVRRNKHPEPL